MMKTRKRLTMLVTVSVPVAMTAAQARKEVKTLITHQANWSAYHEDVKAIAVRGAQRRV